jgi:hypothetical protein
VPKTQIDDVLPMARGAIRAGGPFTRDDGEVVKSLWVRVCQLDHSSHGHGPLQQRIAEASVHADGPPVFKNDRWDLDLPILQGTFEEGDGMATAVLVFESGGDLFTLSWSECVAFEAAEGHDHQP